VEKEALGSIDGKMTVVELRRRVDTFSIGGQKKTHDFGCGKLIVI
jgi:hypothetical protein